jgi:spore coat polysaccharide biosynthesis protein SpsF (cytidylyltransferase family)
MHFTSLVTSRKAKRSNGKAIEKLRGDGAAITQRLGKYSEAIAHQSNMIVLRLSVDCGVIAKRLRNDYTVFAKRSKGDCAAMAQR